MGTKENPGPFDCYANALPDEPMFILLARDTAAPAAIRAWARVRRSHIDMRTRPESDEPMIQQALKCAKEMEDWRKANDGKW